METGTLLIHWMWLNYFILPKISSQVGKVELCTFFLLFNLKFETSDKSVYNQLMAFVTKCSKKPGRNYDLGCQSIKLLWNVSI